MKKEGSAEAFYDAHAKDYSTISFPEGYTNARAAMSFADAITWHFMLKYLPKDKDTKILDAGAGDGFWAQKYVELGYKNIVLTDVSIGMLEQAKERFAKLSIEHNVQFVKSDIANMKEIKTGFFDYVFSQYDPVSYSLKPKEALRELSRVAKKGAYIITCLDTKFRRVPELIEAGMLKEAKTLLETNITQEFDHPQYNLTWEELADCYDSAGLEVIEIVGAPVFMHQVNDKILAKLESDPKVRKELLEIELKYCTKPSLVNFAGHLQMIGRK
ncbi:MAG: class I SAM-dependent methyltransferase [Candidatus Heimdallarchaeota archaeon]